VNLFPSGNSCPQAEDRALACAKGLRQRSFRERFGALACAKGLRQLPLLRGSGLSVNALARLPAPKGSSNPVNPLSAMQLFSHGLIGQLQAGA